MNLNTQFVFENKTKTLLIGGMVLGAVCLGLTFFNDDEYHTRFWTNWLHNSVFFTGIAFMSMFFLSAQITAFAGWNSVVRRVWEAMSQFMWVGLILMGVIVLGIWGHFHHLYHWNSLDINITDPEAPHYDRILAGKKSFLNPVWFTVGTIGFLLIWYYWAKNLRQASVDQDTMETTELKYYRKQRKWAASFLPLGGFLSTVFLWQSVMSIDPHWYSTMFAWYSMISMWLGGLSMTVMLIIYLKSLGYLEYVTQNHLHDIGKFLFGISVFWTYLWFDQFMLIWYANNGEETIYFNERMTHYPVLFWGNLLLNFVVPFLILMRNDTKRKFGTMFFVALIVFFGHWWDYFYMIKPGARIAAHEAKELAEGKHGGDSHSSVAPTTTEANHETPAQPATEGHDAATPATTEAHGADGHTHAAGEAHGEMDTVGSNHDQPAGGSEHPEGEKQATEHPAAEAANAGGHGDGHGHEHDESKAFKLGYTIPGLEEIGILIGFLSLFLFFFFNQLSKASLVPLKDPYLEESLHHDTGALIEGEGGGHH
jgi:cytochrome bd-type quinol oxidase subunit 2